MSDEMTRILRLEETIMQQQTTIDDLNEVVSKQWKLLDQLSRKYTDLDGKLYDLEMSQSGEGVVQKPPHY